MKQTDKQTNNCQNLNAIAKGFTLNVSKLKGILMNSHLWHNF